VKRPANLQHFGARSMKVDPLVALRYE